MRKRLFINSEIIMRMGILDHMGDGNLGDATIQEELNAAVRFLKQVRQRSPHLEALGPATMDQEKLESSKWWST